MVRFSTGNGLDSWLNYYDDFVIKGNNGDDREKSGSLSFYRGTRAVASVAFSNMGVFKCTPEKVESHGDKIRRVKFELYCENMVAKFSG